MEVHKVEDAKGKLLKIGFNRSAPEEDLRVEINDWVKRNYPKMTLREFFSRLDSMSNDFWVVTMEEKKLG